MNEERMDILVVGAGPCGIAVGVAAAEQGLSCVLFDRGAVTQAMLDHPTYTTYFSGPEKLEIAGLPFTTAGDKPSRREAVRYYRRVVEFFGVRVCQFEEVVEIAGAEPAFRVRTRRASGEERVFHARQVVIATGYYDTPNRLAVPGAELPKVLHYFREPFPFFDQDLIVVGGGNSAADAALTCWREGARVTLVHVFESLDRGVKPWVRPDIENRIAEGSIPALWRHKLRQIRWDEVEVECLETGEVQLLRNDWVLAMTGYTPDPRLLGSLGVEIDPTTGIPVFGPDSMETNVPGVYVAGVLAAGFDANKIFIENGKLHGPLIAASAARRLAVGER
jgi:thioredoxin reductase (NADPH)